MVRLNPVKINDLFSEMFNLSLKNLIISWTPFYEICKYNNYIYIIKLTELENTSL